MPNSSSAITARRLRCSIARSRSTPAIRRSWAGLVAAYALANEPGEARRVAEKLKTFAPNLENDDLPRQFGRSENSKLHEGLALAFGSPER